VTANLDEDHDDANDSQTTDENQNKTNNHGNFVMEILTRESKECLKDCNHGKP